MDFSSPLPDFTSFIIQEIGALLFGLVFLFLWRQSRVVYFGLWSIGWLLRLIAAVFGHELMRTNDASWLAPYATFEFAFVIVLVAAARAGFASSMQDWRVVLRLIAILPVFVALVYLAGFVSHLEAYHASNALVLCFVYLYNFLLLGRNRGVGARVFRFSLFLLAAAFAAHAMLFIYLHGAGGDPQWARYLRRESYIDFMLHSVLAFAAMAMWSETQIDRINDLNDDLDQARRETRRTGDLDVLTGLQNQSALARRIESGGEYPGVVAVCDMDNFKDINDRFGHLVGDEILRNIGGLLKASIRHEDEAFRWGGDEFVILFLNQIPEVAAKRMSELEARLNEFHVRGFGSLPISASWGTADARARVLREALDEADRRMYAAKRGRGGSQSAPAAARPGRFS
jgi:diguanylate cyclase (GGDEF)-like protein